MDKKNSSLAVSEKPNYMKLGGSIMERFRITDVPLTASVDGQTAEIVRAVINNLDDVNRESLWPIMPQLGIDEASARAAKAITFELKKTNMSNPFLSEWNELTARQAAARMGLPDKKLHRVIDKHGPVGQKLRILQAAVSNELEEDIKRRIRESGKSDPVFFVSLETWLTKIINSQRKVLNALNPDLAKREKVRVIQDVISTLMDVLDFAPGQPLAISELDNILLRGRLGAPIDVVALHCLSFRNTKDSGIEVLSSAENFVAENSDGSKVLITQNDSLDKVDDFCSLLDTNNIPLCITVLLVDNDAFVGERQETSILSFTESLQRVISSHSLSRFGFKIVRASELVDSEELSSEWNRLREKAREKLVDEEFLRLARRTLPTNMKTREFARKIARKNFLVQVSMGTTIPLLFENSLTLQRARAHQQATQIFNVGASLVGKKPLIVTHWKDMEIVE